MKEYRDPIHRAHMLERLRSEEHMRELFGPHTEAEMIDNERRLNALHQRPDPQQELNLVSQ